MYFTSYQLEIGLNDTVMQYIAKIRNLGSLGGKKPPMKTSVTIYNLF